MNGLNSFWLKQPRNKIKGGSARLAAYGLRPAKQGGSVLPRKAAVLTEQTTVGDKGNMPLQKG
ncbi:hypothetical protein F3157_22020 [Virgibacillus dakarensis]|nr:hypothetical protein [Virgibacillus dakarensis]